MSRSRSKRIQLTYTPRESILTADVSYINPILGTVRQIFTREVDTHPYPDTFQVYTSLFQILSSDSNRPTNFSQLLTDDEKHSLWQEIFGLKNRFLFEQYADVIVHDIKWPFSGERRLAMYREYMALEENGYMIFGSKQSVYIERDSLV